MLEGSGQLQHSWDQYILYENTNQGHCYSIYNTDISLQNVYVYAISFTFNVTTNMTQLSPQWSIADTDSLTNAYTSNCTSQEGQFQTAQTYTSSYQYRIFDDIDQANGRYSIQLQHQVPLQIACFAESQSLTSVDFIYTRNCQHLSDSFVDESGGVFLNQIL